MKCEELTETDSYRSYLPIIHPKFLQNKTQYFRLRLFDEKELSAEGLLRGR